MKTIQECIDLAEWRAQPLPVQKMISGSQMKAFVVTCGLYNWFKHHDGDSESATYDEMVGGGEFNMMTDHPSDITGLFDLMVDTADSTTTNIQPKPNAPDPSITTPQAALGMLKAICLAYANKTTYPNAKCTQEEFDRERAKQVTPAHTVEYPNGMNGETEDLQYHVYLSNKQINLFAQLDAPATYDTTITVLAHEHIPSTSPFEFVATGFKVAVLIVKAGQTTSNQRINTKLTQKVKFSAQADFNSPFKLLVSEG